MLKRFLPHPLLSVLLLLMRSDPVNGLLLKMLTMLKSLSAESYTGKWSWRRSGV